MKNYSSLRKFRGREQPTVRDLPVSHYPTEMCVSGGIVNVSKNRKKGTPSLSFYVFPVKLEGETRTSSWLYNNGSSLFLFKNIFWKQSLHPMWGSESTPRSRVTRSTHWTSRVSWELLDWRNGYTGKRRWHSWDVVSACPSTDVFHWD